MQLKRMGLVILLLTISQVVSAGSGSIGKVAGKVAWDDISRYRGVAALWQRCDSAAGVLVETIGDPAFAVEIGADGSFVIEAPAGEYCLGVVVKRTSGPALGPPAEDDLVFMTPGQNGELFKVEIESGKTLDVGIRTDAWSFSAP
ncbi:hypothetical protein [Trichloromonas sp.]|uniref:hypothetical protein n=1 Tax=Trichloromonas sp. TaxID=3069249 RepID=UPI003D813698